VLAVANSISRQNKKQKRLKDAQELAYLEALCFAFEIKTYGGNRMCKIVRCLLSLPSLPPGEIVQAVSDICSDIADDG